MLFTAAEIEKFSITSGLSPAAAGLLGGMGGGIAQAYATMVSIFIPFKNTTFQVSLIRGHCIPTDSKFNCLSLLT